MQTLSFKETIKNLLFDAAKAYQTLIGRRIFLQSEKFVFKKEYEIRFYEDNFLHLTGVKTKLKAKEFFKKCLNKCIENKDFDCDSTKELKGHVRLKMRNLVNISSYFNESIEVQEGFNKGTIKCLLGTSNNKCTIGFVDVVTYARPMTLLNKNHLDKNKPIISVLPKIK